MNAHVPALIKEVEFKGEALRLPYVPEIEVFGIDNVGWKVLTDTVFPSAQSLEAIVMALAYCQKRNLDVFKRVVHIVPMWSSAKGKMIETVWPGIAELRTTAFRTGQYAGIDEAEYGDEVETVFKDTFTPRGQGASQTREEEVIYPEWCRITTYRTLHGQRCKFVGPKVYWEEAFGRWKGVEVPNEMWSKRPFGQIEKCAEAASLRRAFPEEIGNEYTAEEMEGQLAGADIGGFEIPEKRNADTRRAPAPNKAAEPKQIEAQATETVDTLHQDERERETVPAAQEDEPRPDRRRAPAPNTKPAETKPAEPQKMDVVGIAMQRGYEARKGSNIRRGAVPGEYRDAARKDEASAWQEGWDKADEELKANVGLFNPEATRKAFTAALAKATCEEDVTDAWNKHVAPFLEEMSKPDERDFDKLYVDAKREFAN